MPRASTRLSSDAIANIWARRLLEMRVPSDFVPSKLERDVSLGVRLDALVKRLPDAPLSEPLRAALVGMNALPSPQDADPMTLAAAGSTLSSWLTPAFQQRKLFLAGSVVEGLRHPSLVRMAIEKVSIQLRTYPHGEERLEAALESLLDRALPMFAPVMVEVSRPTAPKRDDGFTRQALTQLLGLVRATDRLDTLVELMGRDAFGTMCDILLEPATGGAFLLGDNQPWLVAAQRRVALGARAVETAESRPSSRRM